MRADGLRGRVKSAQSILSGLHDALRGVDTMQLDLETARQRIAAQDEQLREFQNLRDNPDAIELLSPVPREIGRTLWKYKGRIVLHSLIEFEAGQVSPHGFITQNSVYQHIHKTVRPAFGEVGLNVYMVYKRGYILDD